MKRSALHAVQDTNTVCALLCAAIEEGDDLSSGAVNGRAELLIDCSIGNSCGGDPGHGVIEPSGCGHIGKRMAACSRCALGAVQESNCLGMGHSFFRCKCVGADTGGNTVFSGPEYCVMVVDAGENVGESGGIRASLWHETGLHSQDVYKRQGLRAVQAANAAVQAGMRAFFSDRPAPGGRGKR